MSLQALQEDFSQWLKAEAPHAAERFGEGAQAGLSVYLNNYRGQLMACLIESYPVLRAWLGEEVFAGAAAHHIDRHAPYSWTLDDYPHDFPTTLDARFGSDPEVGELARLERDLAEAFVAPDTPPIDPVALAAVDWDTAVLVLSDAVSISPVQSNAAMIWSAIEAGRSPPQAAKLETKAELLVWRQHYRPMFRMLSADEGAALSMVRNGRTFADICAVLAERRGPEGGVTVAGELLACWIRDGLVQCVQS
ncbi:MULTISPECIES: DNA-binding domain-containing protein [Phenylobacterium]|uniref:Putative DNA-binding domain-containing protein n=1 Tax=Phenylobacterium koreense TaxID=266125 RepID=A0ABV2EEX5_9CAUL